MTPFFFGMERHKLFGIYEPSVDEASRRAVVLCNPWGPEYGHAHRALRHLAIRMNNAGFHTLRFDYFGTGDSNGDFVEAGLNGWQDDIRLAVDELKDVTGVNQVSLVGLRLGATLAATVAAKYPSDITSLILWDPIISGADYIRQLRAGYRDASPNANEPFARGLAGNDSFEVCGFLLTERMNEELQSIDSSWLAELPSNRALVISSEARSQHDEVGRATNDRAEFVHIAAQPAWLEDVPSVGSLPVDIFDRIVEWLKNDRLRY